MAYTYVCWRKGVTYRDDYDTLDELFEDAWRQVTRTDAVYPQEILQDGVVVFGNTKGHPDLDDKIKEWGRNQGYTEEPDW